MKAKRKENVNMWQMFSFAGFLSATFCIIIFTVFQFIFLDDVFLLAAEIRMQKTAEEIINIDFSDKNFKTILSEYEANNTYYLEIYSSRDVLIYTTESNDTVYEIPNVNNEPSELNPRMMSILSHSDNRDGSYFEIRKELYTTSEFLVYGRTFDNDSAIEIYYALDVIRENARVASWALFALSLLVLFTLYFLMWYIAARFTKPLRKIMDTTKKMAKMDFSQRCPSFNLKDLDDLSESINFLSDNLSKSLSELKKENRSLEIDIETQRKHEKSRRSFIANISHELKTPISIIQGYAEGIKLGVGQDSTQEYCDIIIDESHKMNSLVVRLLEYMQYTSGTYKVNITEFSLSKFLESHIENRKLRLKEKEIDISISYPDECFCRSDSVLVENIFNNYLSNAISHIDFERKIIINIEDCGNHYKVSVFNSGKPIPGTDIENIWESFYRADKAHSRKEGRFGLGLSIVATSQDALNQDYGVFNTENGPTFWFDVSK